MCVTCVCVHTHVFVKIQLHKAVARSHKPRSDKADETGLGTRAEWGRERSNTYHYSLDLYSRRARCANLVADQDVGSTQHLTSCERTLIIYIKMKDQPSYLYRVTMYRITELKQENLIDILYHRSNIFRQLRLSTQTERLWSALYSHDLS